MTTFKALLAGLVLGVAALIATGYVAAVWLTATHGHREGAAAMAGFFIIGPIGGVAGFLAGVGLVLRFSGASLRWGNGVMIAAGGIFALQAILLAWTAAPDARPQTFPQVLEFELEMDEADWGPGEVQNDARWGFGQDGPPDQLTSPLWGKHCTAGRCIVQSMAAINAYRPNPQIAVRVHQKKRQFAITLPAEIKTPIDWSEWQAVDDMRLRYRVVLNR